MSSRKVQEAFERLLGEAGSRAERPQHNIAIETEAAELVALSRRLRRLRAVEAPARLRQRGLPDALRSTPRPSRVVPLSPGRLRPSWTMQVSRMAAAIAVALGLGYTAVAASADSLPNSPLYAFRLIIEDVRVAVAPPEEKPRLAVEQLEGRLEAADAMVQVGRIDDASRAMKNAAQRVEYLQAAAVQAPHPQEVRAAVTSAVEQRRGTIETIRQQGGDTPPVLARPVAAVAAPAPAAAPPAAPAAPPQPVPALEPAETPADVAGTLTAPAAPGGFEPIARTGNTLGGAVVEGAAPRLPGAAAPLAAPQSDFGPIGRTEIPPPALAPAAGPALAPSLPAAAPASGPALAPAPGPAAAPAASFVPIGGNSSAQPSIPVPTATSAVTTIAPTDGAALEAPTGGFRSIPQRLPAPNRTSDDSLRSAPWQ